ncbi:uroporphyrinogen-III synthase [Labilibaculum sp.]|uniref:uroporphyrinogen-III synthase n=1 Tax=Labilibaculum sp. TaxID=2060723 RepID=UPI0035678657
MSVTDTKNILFTRSLSPEHLRYASQLDLLLTAKAFIQIEEIPISTEKIDLLNSEAKASWIFTSQNAVKSLSDHVDSLENLKDKKVFAVGERTAEALWKIGVKAQIPKLHNSQSLLDLLEKDNANSFIHFTGNLHQNILSDFMYEKKFEFTEIQCYRTELIQPEVSIHEFDAVCFCSPSAVISFFTKYKIDESLPCVAIGSTTAVKLLDYTDHIVMSERTNVYSMLEICNDYLNS